MVTRAREATAPRLALAADDERTAGEVAAVAGARGFRVEPLDLEAAIDAPVGAIAYVPAVPPDVATAARLAPLCQRAAENRRPIILLAAFERARGRAAEERATSLAWLRSHGAIVLGDPDVWFETAVLIAAYGPPPGPRTCIIAPPGGWLNLSAIALAQEEEARGGARVPQVADPEPSPPVDLALCDGNLGPPARLSDATRALLVPVVARAEHLPVGGPATLVGLRAALGAAHAAGAFAERLSQGLGPAPASEARRLRPEKDKIDKAFARAGDLLGDHESKLLLAAYGVPVVRQGVATTPSAAVRIATICGWPVEIKPWEGSVSTEREGGPLSRGVKNPPDVRRAFADVAGLAGLQVGVPVIVRVTPPHGRDVAARIEKLPELGWTVVAEIPGAGRPIAAPAPLRRADADEIAAALESTRGGDAPPDRAAFADLLVRASFAAVDREAEVEMLELSRVIVAPKGSGALVVDARTRLRKKRVRPTPGGE